MSEDQNVPDVLSTAPAHVQDDRPKFKTIVVHELGGRIRIRRLQPEQCYAFKQKLKMWGVENRPVECPEDLGDGVGYVLCNMVQGSLVPMDTACLLYPGDKGFVHLMKHGHELIQRLANEVLRFNEEILPGKRPGGRNKPGGQKKGRQQARRRRRPGRRRLTIAGTTADKSTG